MSKKADVLSATQTNALTRPANAGNITESFRDSYDDENLLHCKLGLILEYVSKAKLLF